MFIRTTIYVLNELGAIERRPGELPAIVGCPPLRVSVPADADERQVAKDLRRLADELEVSG
jgi:hypothetical protein